MIEQIFYQREYYITILLLTAIGVMGTFLQWGVMRRLVKAAKNVKDTDNHPLIKQMKLGYTNSFKLNYNVKNTKAFIEKYLCRYRFFGMTLSYMGSLREKTSLLCVMACLTAVVWNIYRQYEPVHLINITAITIGTVVLQLFVDKWFSAGEKREYFLLLMQDYFDNVLENRLRNHKKDSKKGEAGDSLIPELPEKYAKGVSEEGDKGYGQTATTLSFERGVRQRDMKIGGRKDPLKSRMHKKENNLTDEQIVEDIIREFFP